MLIIVAAAIVLWVAWSYRNYMPPPQKLDLEIGRVSRACSLIDDAGKSYVTVISPSGNYNRIQLNFRQRKIDDEKLKNLVGLTGIVGLDLSGTNITDSGLASIMDLKSLEYLQVSRTAITDRGVEHLLDLHNLQAVDLAETRVTQNAAKYLERLPRLKVVYAKGTPLNQIRGVRVDKSHESETWFTRGTDPLNLVRDVRKESGVCASAAKSDNCAAPSLPPSP